MTYGPPVASNTDPCDPVQMPGFAMASEMAKDIASGDTSVVLDGEVALSLVDSFMDSPNVAFYNAVILRALTHSDGAFAEPLCIAIHGRLLEQPCSMLSCCWENGCDGIDGLREWARAIAAELMIDEKGPWQGFITYGRAVEQRATSLCDTQTGSRANEFLFEVRKQLIAMMKANGLSVDE